MYLKVSYTLSLHMTSVQTIHKDLQIDQPFAVLSNCFVISCSSCIGIKLIQTLTEMICITYNE